MNEDQQEETQRSPDPTPIELMGGTEKALVMSPALEVVTEDQLLSQEGDTSQRSNSNDSSELNTDCDEEAHPQEPPVSLTTRSPSHPSLNRSSE